MHASSVTSCGPGGRGDFAAFLDDVVNVDVERIFSRGVGVDAVADDCWRVHEIPRIRAPRFGKIPHRLELFLARLRFFRPGSTEQCATKYQGATRSGSGHGSPAEGCIFDRPLDSGHTCGE